LPETDYEDNMRKALLIALIYMFIQSGMVIQSRREIMVTTEKNGSDNNIFRLSENNEVEIEYFEDPEFVSPFFSATSDIKDITIPAEQFKVLAAEWAYFPEILSFKAYFDMPGRIDFSFYGEGNAKNQSEYFSKMVTHPGEKHWHVEFKEINPGNFLMTRMECNFTPAFQGYEKRSAFRRLPNLHLTNRHNEYN